ncbi:hypothetical protein KAI87_12770, partial [Myxococcota bacterium]|nr:hypothetical protein [Myxococcota bacterium]
MTNRISLNSFILGAALLSFSACSSDSPDGKDGGEGINALLDVVAVPVGDSCAAGGYTVNAGADTNANGVLDADEITSTSTMCNGEEGSDGDAGSDGLASLIEKTELPLDDENCPESGVRLDVGVDNGDGGGIADDGILQAGEVDDSTFVCSADNAIVAKPLTPPDSPVGAFTMNMNGGAASDGSGGDGGCFEVYMDPGTLTGHIKVFSTGVADASFDFPETIHTYLGSEPLVVDGDLTIESYATGDHSTMQAGQYHLHDGEALDVAALYKWTGTQDVKVTGVKVNAGATLTFAANQTDTSIFNIDNDFILAGTLTTELDGLNRIELKFYCDTYYGEEGSVIDLSGKDAPAEGTDGGRGGDFVIYADDQDQDFYEGWGSIFSHSDVDVSGGEGDNGGRGGSVKFAADLAIITSGDIFANGGTGLVGSGGHSQN